MIRILTLYVVPISFAIILLIGLVGNTLVIFVVSSVIILAISIDYCIEVKKDHPRSFVDFEPCCQHDII